MKIAVLPGDQEIAQLGANMFTSLLDRKPDAILGLATGSSPLPVYDELIARYKRKEVSFKDVTAFLLDEYVGLPFDHPETYRNFIRRVLGEHVDFRPEAVHGPDGLSHDPYQAAADYQELIESYPRVDLQILGIGTDGHIAFNEPGGSLSSKCHPQVLFTQTRVDNARFFGDDVDNVPTMALTQGLTTIMRARKIVLVAQGTQKADAIAQMVEGPVSANWPATILQFHEDVTVLADEEAASKLVLKDHYADAWKMEHERLKKYGL